VGALHEQAHPAAREFLRKNKESPAAFEQAEGTKALSSFDYKSIVQHGFCKIAPLHDTVI